MMNSRFKLAVVTSSTCLMILLLFGAVIGKSAGPEDPYRHLAVFSEVLSRIKSDYVEEPDVKNVTLGALNGLLESIDPYASYLNADQFKQWSKNKDQNKANVGLILSKKYGYIGVVDAIPGSPADKAGIGSLDMLETIKGVSTQNMPLAYAELLLQGDPGSTIDVQVLRVRRPEPQKITLTRANIKMPSLSSRMLSGEIGYIQAQSLEAGKSQLIANAIQELQNKGAKKLVLDVRNSAAGTPEEGVALANLFLDKGLITYLKGQKVSRQDFEAAAEKARFKMPVAVITNRGTAHSAEIAAAALLDSKRADVVGERTYGDAAVRKPITMDDGSAVILSVAKYYSPSGKAIQDTGVTPNVPVNEVEAPIEDPDSENAPPPEPQKPAEDLLLNKAVEVLTKGAAQASTSAVAEKQADRQRGPGDVLTTVPPDKKQ
jgi:carboxyl-terminal processing protease